MEHDINTFASRKKERFFVASEKNKKSQAWEEEGGKKSGAIYQVINQISHSCPMLLLFPCSDEQLHSGIMIYWATTFKLDTKMRRAWKRKLLNETQILCLNCFEETERRFKIRYLWRSFNWFIEATEMEISKMEWQSTLHLIQHSKKHHFFQQQQQHTLCGGNFFGGFLAESGTVLLGLETSSAKSHKSTFW